MKKPMIIGTLSVIVLAMVTSILMFSSSSMITETIYWGIKCESESSCTLVLSGGELETEPEEEETGEEVEPGEETEEEETEPFVSEYDVKDYYDTTDSADWDSPSDIPWYSYRTKITSVVLGGSSDIIVPSTMYAWFYGMNHLTNIDFSYVDSTYANNMSYLFFGCTNLVGSEVGGETYLDLSSLNTQNAENNSEYVFTYTDSLNAIRIGTKMTLNFEYGFWQELGTENEYYYTNVPMGNKTYENVTDRYYWGITDGVLTISDQEVSGTVTGSAYEGSRPTWFEKTSSDLVAPITSIIVGSEAQVFAPRTMAKMFANLKNVTEIDLTNLDTSNVVDMSYLFKNCKRLETLDLSNLTTESVLETIDTSSSSNLFTNCIALNEVTIGNDWEYTLSEGRWLDSNEIAYENGIIPVSTEETYTREALYWGVKTDGTLIISNKYVETKDTKAIDLSDIATGFTQIEEGIPNTPWYELSDDITKIKIEADDKIQIENFDLWFAGLYKVTSIDLSGLDASEITSMNYTFAGMESITKIDLSDLDLSSLEEMEGTFTGCISVTEIKFQNNFNPTGLYNLYGTFSYCEKLKKLDLHYLITDYEAEDYSMESTFSGCTALSELDITSLAVNSAAELADGYLTTFEDCDNLGILKLGTESIQIMKLALGTVMPNKEWYYISNDGGTETIETVSSINDISTPGTYYKEMPKTVSFYASEGGTLVNKQIVITGGKITLDYPLTKDSDVTQVTTTFETNGGEEVNPVSTDKTASYSLAGYKIGTTTYDIDDEYTVNEDTTVIGVFEDDEVEYENFELPTTTKFGYRFLGWAADNNQTTGVTGIYTPNGSHTLYAVWEKIIYETMEENVSFNFTVGDEDVITYTIDAPFEKFDKLYINDHELSKGIDYTALSGSTIITFTETGMDYIENLTAGSYTIKASFTDMDGTVDVPLTITAASNPDPTDPDPTDPVNPDPADPTEDTEDTEEETKSPKTGDNIVIYIITAFIALVVGVTVLFKTKIRKAN